MTVSVLALWGQDFMRGLEKYRLFKLSRVTLSLSPIMYLLDTFL